MYCMYGSYRHPDNEVNLVNMEIIPMYSERGAKYASLVRMDLIGELIYTGQDELSSRIEELIEAYRDNNKTFALYQDDGTMTNHKIPMEDPNNVSGVKVVKRSWPKGDPAEYATTRTFQITLQALFRDTESDILEYRESVQFVGDGGLQWEWVRTPTGQSYQQIIYEQEPQTIIQSGKVTAFSNWPIGNVPPPIFPAWEHRNLRVMKYGEPIFAGNPVNRQYKNYSVNWTYMMQAPYFVNASPSLY